MPAKSKAQLRLMAGVAGGSFSKPGLKPAVAKEFVAATPKGKTLPQKVTKPKEKR